MDVDARNPTPMGGLVTSEKGPDDSIVARQEIGSFVRYGFGQVTMHPSTVNKEGLRDAIVHGILVRDCIEIVRFFRGLLNRNISIKGVVMKGGFRDFVSEKQQVVLNIPNERTRIFRGCPLRLGVDIVTPSVANAEMITGYRLQILLK